MDEENDERVEEEQEMDEMENHQRNHIGKKNVYIMSKSHNRSRDTIFIHLLLKWYKRKEQLCILLYL